MASFLFLFATFLFFQSVRSCNVQSSLLESTWGLVDEGEIAPAILLLRNQILKDASSSSYKTWALAATYTAVGELAWPRSASGCGHAKIINANDASSVSKDELDDAIDSYAVVLAQAADNLRILGACCILPAPWPVLDNSCGDYGRSYDFSGVWDDAKGRAGSDARCSARNLYAAFNARSNQVGAAVTSAATDAASIIFNAISSELIDFLSHVVKHVSGSACKSKQKELRTKAGSLKSAIFDAAEKAKSQLSRRCRH